MTRRSPATLVLSLALSLPAAAQKGAEWAKLPPVPAPLGSIGDVVQASEGGFPADEHVVLARLPGCDRPQAIHVSRFLAGALEGAAKIQAAVDKADPSGRLERRLFGARGKLVEAIRGARAASPADVTACQTPPASEGWKLSLAAAPSRLCGPGAGERSFRVHLFVSPAVRALVMVSPAPDDRPDRCRPRLSAAIFDAQGRARFRYHADYGGALTAELLGERCRSVVFAFDASTESFRAAPVKPFVGCGQR